MDKENKLPVMLLLLAIVVMSFSLVFGKAVGSETVKQNVVETTVAPTSVYTLKSYNGKLAVFVQGDNKPIEILDRFVDDLPEDDKTIIEKGITAVNKSQLQRLIEDYTS